MFICGLSRPNDSDTRTRFLAKIESAPKKKLTDLVNECHRIQTLKNDTEMVEKQLVEVNKIDSKRKVPNVGFAEHCTIQNIARTNRTNARNVVEGFCRNSKTSGGNNSSDSNSSSGRNSSNINGNFHFSQTQFQQQSQK